MFVPVLAQADINIAVIAPKVGEFEKAGQEIISGVKLGVDEINADGGIIGHKINMIAVDDICNDRLAVSTAQMMSLNVSEQDKIFMVIGPYCSNALKEVADIYASAKIFQIIPTTISSSDAPSDYQGLVKMLGYKDNQGIDFFKFYEDEFSDQKTALIYDGDNRNIVEVAISIQKEFRQSMKADMLKTYNVRNYHNPKDIAKDILDRQIGVVYMLTSIENIVDISKTLKKADSQINIFINQYPHDKTYREKLGKLAEGTYFIGLPSLKNSPEFTAELVKLRLKGIEPQGLSVYGYSAFLMWSNLVKKAGSVKYEDLSKELQNKSIDAGWSNMMYVNGNPSKDINYSIYKLENGEYTQVY